VYPTCANCGIVITWQPTVVNGRTYCCVGCSRGGPCTCDYNRLPTAQEDLAVVIYKPALPDKRPAPDEARAPAGQTRNQGVPDKA